MLLVLLLACGRPEAPAAIEPVPVVLSQSDVSTVAAEAISAGPRVSGTLEPASKAIIRAEAGGAALSVDAEIGEPVEKGAVLAHIEATAARQSLASATASVASAEADVANTRRELERVTRLHESGALSARDQELAESALVAAEARLMAARAQRAAAAEQVDGATVRAPFAGVVAERQVGQGDIVGIGTPLFTVIDPSTLRLEGAVPAESAGQVRPGTPARLTVQGMGDRAFEGVIERVSPAVDPATRQIPVLVSIPNQDGTLLAGLFAEGRVATEQHEGLVVPLAALAGDSVLAVRDGKVAQVPVQLGIRDEEAERVEIKGELVAGEVVLVGAAREIEPGTAVQVRGQTEG